jgi:uncharacterized phage protein (TIGR02216 family)
VKTGKILPVYGEVAAAPAADGGGSPRAVRSRSAPSTTAQCAAVPLPVNGEDFGSSAARLSGLCTVLLGWSPDAFWRATPAEVGAAVAVLAPAGDAPVTRKLLEELEARCG